jgi:hypothetical protein
LYTFLKLVLSFILVLGYFSGLYHWYQVFITGRYYAAGTLFTTGMMLLLPVLFGWLIFRALKFIHHYQNS